MISVIMPFWERQEAWNKAMRLLVEAYPKLDMEVVVVSDGSACEQQVDAPWPVRIYHLPEKPKPLSPCVPLNVGVAFAKGDVILLTNPEILHDHGPILPQLLEELERLGPTGFVMASAWCPEQNMWHCHSTRAWTLSDGWRGILGAGYYFCGLMYRDFFYKVGSIHEGYRLGAGWEDHDFCKLCEAAGAVFKVRDDLVVTHPKAGARTPWADDAFSINKKLFTRRWQPNLTVTCLKWGDAYGPEYVNRLYAGVTANLPDDFAGKFVCFTDNSEEICEGVECRPIPVDLPTWWGKLSLFKRGVFPDGERVFYFDLDTVIVGDLERILSYNGPFAILRDFYRPEGYGSAMMAWEAGKYCHIWDTYEAVSKLSGGWIELEGGDQAWVERVQETAERLQDVYRGQISSFKVDSSVFPAKTTSVVCFHGEPKPHNCETEWVQAVWEKGMRLTQAMLSVPNAHYSTMQDNIAAACKRDIPWLQRLPAHEIAAVLVGGGPSVGAHLQDIQEWQAAGQLIVTFNGSHDYLRRKGIISDYQVIMDARPDNLRFVKGATPRKSLLLSSQCHPSLFDAVNGAAVTLFHNYTSLAVGIVAPREGYHIHFVGGGNTVGLATMAAMYSLGCRIFHLYGYDSSYTEGSHHAYDQALNDKDRVVEAVTCGQTFKTTGWMVDQVNQFQELATQLANAGCVITVHGDGLLPTVAREMAVRLSGDRNGTI
jgi:hypothetical protein